MAATDEAGSGGEIAPSEAADVLTLLYEEAKQTIAVWCRDAERSAAALLASSEMRRREAEQEAQAILDKARQEAERIEKEATESHPEPRRDELSPAVVDLVGAVDDHLAALEEAMVSVGSVSGLLAQGAVDDPICDVELDLLRDRVDVLSASVSRLLGALDSAASDPQGRAPRSV